MTNSNILEIKQSKVSTLGSILGTGLLSIFCISEIFLRQTGINVYFYYVIGFISLFALVILLLNFKKVFIKPAITIDSNGIDTIWTGRISWIHINSINLKSNFIAGPCINIELKDGHKVSFNTATIPMKPEVILRLILAEKAKHI